MPTVVFQINGRKYPLPPSAYTSQVGLLGVRWGEPQAHQALHPPGESAELVISGGTPWRSRQGVCSDRLTPLKGTPWSWAHVCGRCSLVLGGTGQVGRTEARV